MKKELAVLALAGIVNHAAAAEAETVQIPMPESPAQHHEDQALISSRGRRFDLAPHLQGTRERKRAAAAGAVIEIEIP